ncbi:MAG: hypothetical protein PHI65_01330 [Firmicutes bacterium]|nr:hypothetical protein [Bacillota bacterium]
MKRIFICIILLSMTISVLAFDWGASKTDIILSEGIPLWETQDTLSYRNFPDGKIEEYVNHKYLVIETIYVFKANRLTRVEKEFFVANPAETDYNQLFDDLTRFINEQHHDVYQTKEIWANKEMEGDPSLLIYAGELKLLRIWTPGDIHLTQQRITRNGVPLIYTAICYFKPTHF